MACVCVCVCVCVCFERLVVPDGMRVEELIVGDTRNMGDACQPNEGVANKLNATNSTTGECSSMVSAMTMWHEEGQQTKDVRYSLESIDTLVLTG
jgi:hypothetical protein